MTFHLTVIHLTSYCCDKGLDPIRFRTIEHRQDSPKYYCWAIHTFTVRSQFIIIKMINVFYGLLTLTAFSSSKSVGKALIIKKQAEKNKNNIL